MPAELKSAPAINPLKTKYLFSKGAPYGTDEEGDKAQAAVPLFNEEQRYCYLPNMKTDEVLVLKQLDSRSDKSLVCPHTSFIDPSAPADAAERESIDIRFMCVFPKKVNSF